MMATTDDRGGGRAHQLKKICPYEDWEARGLTIACRWINHRLKANKVEEKRLMSNLRSGEVLWSLVETLKGGKPIHRKRCAKIDIARIEEESARGIHQRMEALHNHRRVFKKMKELGISVIGVGPNEMVLGSNIRHGLALIWAITRKAMEQDPKADAGLNLVSWALLKSSEDDNDVQQLSQDIADEPPEFKFQIKNLDTGKVLDLTPHKIVEVGGLITKDTSETIRHQESIRVWNGTTIKDLDSGQQLSPNTILVSDGIFGDERMCDRHRQSLELFRPSSNDDSSSTLSTKGQGPYHEAGLHLHRKEQPSTNDGLLASTPPRTSSFLQNVFEEEQKEEVASDSEDSSVILQEL